MNQYGNALSDQLKQTILPVMTKDGSVRGFLVCSEQTYEAGFTTGTYTTSDGVQFALSTVTTDPNDALRVVNQYVAAVFPVGLAQNYIPWSSQDTIYTGDIGYYSNWAAATDKTVNRYNKGVFLEGFHSGFDPVVTISTDNVPDPIAISSASQTWNTTIRWIELLGDCMFFDFNWVEAFKAKSGSVDSVVRISVVSNPVDGSGHTVMKANIVSLPIIVGLGAIQFNTIRVTKLDYNLQAGLYVFQFMVHNTAGGSTPVTFNLTVA